MKFKDTKAANHLLEKLNEQRQNKSLCDIEIVTGGSTYAAHKNVLAAESGYFEARFSCGLDENARLYELPVMGPGTFHTVLDFIYTGEVDIGLENVQDVLSLSDYLMVSRLRDFCFRYLEYCVKDQKLLILTKCLADQYGQKALAASAVKCLERNFQFIIKEPDILMAPAQTLKSLLCEHSLSYIREQDIFDLIVRWTNYDLGLRENSFSELFSIIHLDLMPILFIEKIVLKNSLVQRHISPDRVYSHLEKRRKSEARCVTKDVIVFIGAEKQTLAPVVDAEQQAPLSPICRNNCYSYRVEEDTWIEHRVPDIDFAESRVHSTAHKGKVYLIGTSQGDLYDASNASKRQCQFYSFDIVTGDWYERSSPDSMEGPCRLVSSGGYLYAFGSNGHLKKYDARLDQWKDCARYPGVIMVTLHLQLIPSEDCIYVLNASATSGMALRGRIQGPLQFHSYNIADDQWHSLPDLPGELAPGGVLCRCLHVIHNVNNRRLIIKNATGRECAQFDLDQHTWISARQSQFPAHVIPYHIYNMGPTFEIDNYVFMFSQQNTPTRNVYQAAKYHNSLGIYKLLHPCPISFDVWVSTACHIQVPR